MGTEILFTIWIITVWIYLGDKGLFNVWVIVAFYIVIEGLLFFLFLGCYCRALNKGDKILVIVGAIQEGF